MGRAYNLLMLPLVLAAAGGHATAGTRADSVRCEIRSVNTSGGTQLQAIALAAGDATGEYELEVRKSGGGGTSSTSQSGDFDVIGTGETVLSEVTIGGGGAIAAKLTLWSAAGDVVCTAEFPNKI